MKRAGLLGPLDRLTAYLGPRVLPPPSEETRVRMAYGMELILPPRLPSHRNYATGLYEVDVTRLITSLLQPGMVFVDVGANIGYYTMLASKLVGEQGHVHAFEPDPTAFAYLKRNAAINQCSNVTAVNKAIGDTIGVASFTASELERGFISDDSVGTIPVEQVTLDSYFDGLDRPHVDLIKLDVEGAEERALVGMKQIVGCVRGIQLIMELNTEALARSGTTASSLVQTVRDIGFGRGYVIELQRHIELEELLPGSSAVHNVLLTTGRS